MAVLAIAAAGAGAGSALGIGAGVGWAIGSVVGNLLFGPKPQSTITEGPRLGDLTVTSSAYGAPIPYGYGTVRMAGNIVWSTSIQEHQTVQRQRVGGKGGAQKASQTTVTYTYTCSFAVAFGEGPANGVIKIWADSKLIYDANAEDELPDAVQGLVFRFYPGNETQLPEGIEVADKGDGNVPAYRGIARIVFDDMPLQNFGNRIPNITAEIAFKPSTPSYPVRVWTPIQHPQAARVTDGNVCAVDYQRGVVYMAKFIGAQGTRAIRRMQYRTLIEDRVVLDNDVFTISDPADFSAMANLYIGRDGYIYGNGSGGNSKPIVRIDPNSMKQVEQWGISSVSTVNSAASFASLTTFGMASCLGAAGRIDFLICGGFTNQVGILRATPLEYVWGSIQSLDEARQVGIAGGDIFDESGTAFVVGGGTVAGPGLSPNLGIYQFTITVAASYSPITEETIGVEFEKLDTISAGDLIVGSSNLAACVLVGRDPTDGGLVIGIEDSVTSERRMIKWTAADGVLWNTEVPDYYNASTSAISQNNRLDGSTYSWLSGEIPRTIDLRTGELTIGSAISGLASGYPQVYDYKSNSILFRNGSDGGGTGSVYWKKVFLGRAEAAGDLLSNIVTDLCARAGLDSVDIDVTELTDEVKGYVITRPTSARASIEILTQPYFFNGVESDFILKFPKRGGANADSLIQSELAFVDESTGIILSEKRAQEVELPERINVLYIEKDSDYQQGVQFTKRITNPYASMSSKNQANVELPIVLEATESKQISEKMLYTSWIERDGYQALLSWAQLLLDPGDVITITLDSGAQFRIRIIKVELGANMALDMEFMAQEAATYISNAIGSQGNGFPQQVIPGTAFTKLFLLDVPLLRDMDDTGGISSRTYYFQAGYGPSGWPGALLYKSQDNVSFAQVGQSNIEASWGTCANILGVPEMEFATDEINTLTVFMATGADNLLSVSQLEMLNGANGAVLLKADGTPEIIQYRDVIENDDGSFTLSGLLRGRRGTDPYVGTHEAGELFLLLELDAAEAILLGLAELNVVRFYRGVGFNSLFEASDLETRTNTGRDLKPWAPVHVRAQDTSSGDIEITWDRRTRINGALLNFVGDVPLNEETEAYEIDITDGSSGLVIRTLVATTTSVTYTAAQIAVDFGFLPNELIITAYQMSAAVGRGFGVEHTVEVE